MQGATASLVGLVVAFVIVNTHAGSCAYTRLGAERLSLQRQLRRPALSCLLRLRGGKARRQARQEAQARARDQSDGSAGEESSSSSQSGSMHTSTEQSQGGAGRMIRRDDIVTADECTGHAEAAIEAGEFEDAADFLHAALEDIEDEFGADSFESVPVRLLYSKALMGQEMQNAAEPSRAGSPDSALCEGDEDESSGPEDAAHAAWRLLEDAKRIVRQHLDRDTKELADAHEMQAQFAESPLSCPALSGKTPGERRAIAREHLQACLRIRTKLLPNTHESILRVQDKLGACEEG